MRVALDVDDVIAGFYEAACRKCNVPFNDRVDHWEQPFISENWDDIASDTEFWRTLRVINKVDFEFSCYLTSVPNHIIEHRQFWIENNDIPNKPLIVSYDKVEMADLHDLDVLIDDKPENIELWINSGRQAIQYIPHNFEMPIKSPHFTNDFSEIKHILDKLKKEYYGKSKGVQSTQAQK
jgi:hypothetical protein